LGYAGCSSVREYAGVTTKFLSVWRRNEELHFAPRATFGFRANWRSNPAKVNVMMRSMLNCVHRLKIGDLIIFFIAVDMMDLETIWNRAAMRFPYFTMEKDQPLCGGIPSGIVTF
jgi:hypothetical protein